MYYNIMNLSESIVIIILGIIISILLYKYYNSKKDYQVTINEINPKNTERYNKLNRLLKVFENKMSHFYPLGDTEFRILHGNNYFSFFERIGKPYFNIVKSEDDNKIIATGCGILRTFLNNNKPEKCWYICDLKIDKNHRGIWLPLKMLNKSLYLKNKSNKGYGVSMNVNGKQNKIVKLAKNLSSIIPFKFGGNLKIYQLGYDDMNIIHNYIMHGKGRAFYVSLDGIKDLYVKDEDSRVNKMPLLHLNYFKNMSLVNDDFNDNVHREPQVGYQHMFCLHEKDPFVKVLNELKITTKTSASIVHTGMDNLKPEDWSFIQTSEI
jgi:hypothetical protein